MHTQNHKSKEYQKAVGRARSLVRQLLEVFPGYPTTPPQATQQQSEQYRRENVNGSKPRNGDLTWQTIPADSKSEFRLITISAHRIQEVCRSVQLLRTTFREHLDRVISTADQWLLRMQTAVDELSTNMCHELEPHHPSPQSPSRLSDFINRAPLPRRWKDLACNLVWKHPELCEFLASIIWIELTSVDQPELKSLEWIEQNAGLLFELSEREGIELSTLTMLYQLSSDTDHRWLNFLMRVLANPLISRQEASNHTRYFDELNKKLGRMRSDSKKSNTDIPARQVYQCEWAILDSLRRMRQMTSIQRGVISRLFSNFVSEELLDIDEQTMIELELAEQHLRRQLTKLNYIGRTRYLEEGNQLNEGQIESVKGKSFLIGNVLNLYSKIEKYCEETEQLRDLELFARTLKGLSKDQSTRLFLNWLSRIDDKSELKGLCRLLNCLVSLFSRIGVSDQLVDIWMDFAYRERKDWTIEHVVFSRSLASFKRLLRVIEQLIYVEGHELSNVLLCELAELFDKCDDIPWCTSFARFRATNPNGWPVDFWHHQLLHMLDPEAKRLCELAVLLEKNDGLRSSLDELAKSSPPGWLLDAVRYQVNAGSLQHVTNVGKVARIVRSIRMLDEKLQEQQVKSAADDSNAVPSLPGEVSEAQAGWLQCKETISSQSDWIGAFPMALQADLKTLNQALGESTHEWAIKTLGKDCPDLQKLSKELSEVRRLLSGELDTVRRVGLKRRAEKLDKWMLTTQDISEPRIANLRSKIQNRLMLATVESNEKYCREWLVKRLTDYGMPYVAPELLQHPYSQILPALLELKEPSRTVGLKVLAKGMESPELFLSEPANVRFMERINGLGIKMDRWLNPQFVIQKTRKDGTAYRVGFAKSSLDIFLMGFHFQTCLSPHNINFFSTIANVADVNKRVLYGTTDDGRIVGRCLVCLTNSGEILSYHRYQHDCNDGFSTAVDEFLVQLARAMGTIVSQRGHVPRLVVREWYDDGCYSLGWSYVSIFDGKIKPVLETEARVSLMSRCVHEAGSRQAVLDSLDQIVHFIYSRRRKLAPAVLAWLTAEEMDEQSDSTLVLAALANNLGEVALAQAAVSSLPLASFRKRMSRQRLGELLRMPPVADLLVDKDAVGARRLFLDTRPANVRCDVDESDPTRCKALAAINKKLYRHRIAERLQLQSRA